MKLYFAYFGKLNRTNAIISEMLQNNFTCTVEFFDALSFMEQVDSLNSHTLDLVIIDLNTIPGNDPQTIRKISGMINNAPILALDIYNKEKLIRPVIDSGAKGVLGIAPDKNELTQAVNALLAGNGYIRDLES